MRRALLAILVAATHGLAQDTIHVPADQPTIQAGINAATDGGVVLVAPGTYKETVNFSKKAITVTSSGGPSVTIIDGDYTGTPVTFNQGETNTSVLQGFTIQHGNGGGSTNTLGEGGGISIEGSSPTITGNIITNNSACYAGSGIGVGFGNPIIQGNTITNNGSASCGSLGGGGISFRGGSSGMVIGNIITGNASNQGGGIELWAGGAVTIRNNIIMGNTASSQGGGIDTVNEAPAIIVQNLIVGNTAPEGAAMFFSNAPASAINNTIANNSSAGAPSGAAVVGPFQKGERWVGNLIIAQSNQIALSCSSFGATAITGTFQNNDVYSPTGAAYAYEQGCGSQTGTNKNISVDPIFLGNGNYHVQSGSPVIGAGDPTAPELQSTDLDGDPRFIDGKVDMGAYEYQGPTTLTATPLSLSFPEQALGASSSVQAVTIANTGSAPLQVASVSITGDFSEVNTCSPAAGVPALSNCIVSVTFTPTARGTRTGTLTIASNASGSPTTIALSGIGIGAVVSTPATLTFANQLVGNTSPPQVLTLANTGDAPLTFTNISVSANFGQTNTCAGTTTPINASCTISVTFTPTTPGTLTGTLLLSDSATGSPQTINLTGNGQAAAPMLSAVSPSTATADGPGFTLTATGSGFNPTSVIQWGGANRATTYVSATQLTAAVTAADIANGGSFPVTVSNGPPGGGVSGAVNVTVENPAPVVSSLSPASALVGGSDFQLTVNGSGFVTGSTVLWNGSPRSTTFVSRNQLRASITATDISLATTSQVSVFNPVPGGGTSGSSTFTAVVPTPTPSLSSISPNTATAGSGAFTLTVNGNGFVSTSVVLWSGSGRSTTYINSAQLEAAILATDVQYGGTALVSVSNPPPGGGATTTDAFTVVGSPLPAISSVQPSSLSGGSAGANITVNGIGFTSASVVQWNGQARVTTFVIGTQLTAAILASDLSAVGTGQVTVLNPPPGGGASNAFSVSITSNPVPVIQTITPASLPVGGSGQALQVQGSGFSSSTVVRWNGQNRPTTMVNNSTLSILLTAADLATPGLVDVTVYNPPDGGGLSSPLFFAVTVPLAPRGMAYDATRGTLWVSVGSSDPTYGNQVVPVNPTTGIAGPGVLVGSNPSKVEISDDGSYLYVALDGAAAVRRVNLATQTADLQFPVGADIDGTLYVDDMVVISGSPHTVAISRKYLGISPSFDGVAIFDDGVQRPTIDNAYYGIDKLEPSASPTTLYGLDTDTTGFEFHTVTVTANGAVDAKSVGDAPLGGFSTDIKFVNPYIYALNGAVYNPQTASVVGTYSLGMSGPYSLSGTGVAPDPANDRTSMTLDVFGSGIAHSLAVFDQTTFLQRGAFTIPAFTAAATAADTIMRVGANTLAMRGTAQLFLLQSIGLVPPAVTAAGLVNGASFAAGPVAPGSLVSLFGTGLSLNTLAANSVPLPVSLGGTAVTMDGIGAPIVYMSSGQINFQVPWEENGKSTGQLVVGAPGFTETPVKLPLAQYAPGVFTVGSNNQAAALVANTAILAAPVGTATGSRPANRGESISIYCTGLGPVNNQPPTGAAAPGGPAFATTPVNPMVTLGGESLNVSFSGLAPGFVGLYQVNAAIPSDATTGPAVPLIISIGGSASNTATIAVR
jgi:uncharacterized protein (TIGR03437 family)